MFISIDHMIFWACLFLRVHQHTAYVLMSVDEELCVSANRAHWRAGVCVASVHVWAQEACSCMTQVPHDTLALALLSTTLQAALVKRLSRIINTYTLIICWNTTSISVDLTNTMQTAYSVCTAALYIFFICFRISAAFDQLRWNDLRTVDGMQDSILFTFGSQTDSWLNF